MVHAIFKRIAARNKELAIKLIQAEIFDEPDVFVKKTFHTAMYMTFGLFFILFGFLAKSKGAVMVLFLFTPVLLIILYLYFSHLPDVKMLKRERAISREIVFAGRFLIIEFQSGVPLYDAMISVAENYPEIGKVFREIISKVDLGTPTEDAINEAIDYTPSPDLRKILWQIVNSLRTGADISHSLESVLIQIARGQVISINEYGKKLNPIAMFYMIIAVILPSIGITMLIVLSTFVSFELKLGALLGIAVLMGFLQFMFVAMIKSQRPAVEL